MPETSSVDPIVKSRAWTASEPTITLITREVLEERIGTDHRGNRHPAARVNRMEVLSFIVFDPENEGRHYVFGVPAESIRAALDLPIRGELDDDSP
jgi:hypothetical protein